MQTETFDRLTRVLGTRLDRRRLGAGALLAALTAATRHAAAQEPVIPTAIRIPRALVETRVESMTASVDGRLMMTGSWVVGWYPNSGTLGTPGNVVLNGFHTWNDIGPAVFFFLDQLTVGEKIVLTGDDGLEYRYEVASVERYDAFSTPWAELFAPTATETMTVLTDAGWDCVERVYREALVIQAVRLSGDEPRPAISRDDAPVYTPGTCAQQEIPVPVSGYRDLATLEIDAGVPADRQTLAEINALLGGLEVCTLAAHEALALPTGEVLALVGPDGAVQIEALTDVIRWPAGNTDPFLVALYSYLLFTPAADGWEAALLPPWGACG